MSDTKSGQRLLWMLSTPYMSDGCWWPRSFDARLDLDARDHLFVDALDQSWNDAWNDALEAVVRVLVEKFPDATGKEGAALLRELRVAP